MYGHSFLTSKAIDHYYKGADNKHDCVVDLKVSNNHKIIFFNLRIDIVILIHDDYSTAQKDIHPKTAYLSSVKNMCIPDSVLYEYMLQDFKEGIMQHKRGNPCSSFSTCNDDVHESKFQDFSHPHPMQHTIIMLFHCIHLTQINLIHAKIQWK